MKLTMTTLAANYAGEKVLGVLLIILLVVMVILLFSVPWIEWFRQELKYINNEIGRNTGAEQERWKRRKRRLLLSIIPFVKYE